MINRLVDIKGHYNNDNDNDEAKISSAENACPVDEELVSISMPGWKAELI